MFAALIAVVVVIALVAFLMRKKPAQSSAASAAAGRAARTALPAAGTSPVAGTTGAQAPLPANGSPATPAAASAPLPKVTVPTDSRLIRVDSLSDTRKQELLAELRTIPRPPRALHQLVSPDFVDRASSNELSDLVMSEPVVAARVMAAVNSPLYGLRQTVTSVGQAITFLGLNSVRSMCLQYLLIETLPPGDAQLRKEFDTLWRASALASELCLQLAKRLQLPDAAGMATQLVLSFLGRFAAATLMQRAGATTPAGTGMLQRALAEQQQLGLSAGELGYLLMQEWGLPDVMVAETRGIGRVLFMGAPAPDPARASRLALTALSAGIGESIARGELKDLGSFEPATADSEDLVALRRHLDAQTLAVVAETVHSPEMVRMLG